jgi:dipeptidase E
LFLPYARPGGATYDAYTRLAAKAFQKIDIKIKGIHEFKDPNRAIESSKGIFVGGGNTFVLVNQLHKNDLIPALRKAVNNGIPYLGTSAGSNICGLNICTTNDMPIIYPPSFKTLALVPFNINPHYLDPDPSSTHMGETRETRIKEFHSFNTQPVVGLREGSFLQMTEDKIILKGNLSARIFEQNKPPYEIESNGDLSYLN